MTEEQIIQSAYYISEKGSDPWASGDDEYTTARNLANIAIGRWESYDNTVWKDLFTTLDDAASSVTKTITASTYDYACATNMVRPASYVRTVDSGGTSTYWQVIEPQELGHYANSSQNVCWFTGSVKDGYTLHFNSNVTLTTGDTIKYEFYKSATKFSTTTDVTEVSDPYFIAYFIAAHMAEEGVDPDFNNMAESRLEDMRVKNLSQLYGVSQNIPTSFESGDGFGY
jgi:hypothetical protein